MLRTLVATTTTLIYRSVRICALHMLNHFPIVWPCILVKCNRAAGGMSKKKRVKESEKCIWMNASAFFTFSSIYPGISRHIDWGEMRTTKIQDMYTRDGEQKKKTLTHRLVNHLKEIHFLFNFISVVFPHSFHSFVVLVCAGVCVCAAES